MGKPHLPPDDLYDLKEFYSHILSKLPEKEVRYQCESLLSFCFSMQEIVLILEKLTTNDDEFNDNLIRTIFLNFFKLCHINKRLIRIMNGLYPRFSHLLEDTIADRFRN